MNILDAKDYGIKFESAFKTYLKETRRTAELYKFKRNYEGIINTNPTDNKYKELLEMVTNEIEKNKLVLENCLKTISAFEGYADCSFYDIYLNTKAYLDKNQKKLSLAFNVYNGNVIKYPINPSQQLMDVDIYFANATDRVDIGRYRLPVNTNMVKFFANCKDVKVNVVNDIIKNSTFINGKYAKNELEEETILNVSKKIILSNLYTLENELLPNKNYVNEEPNTIVSRNCKDDIAIEI